MTERVLIIDGDLIAYRYAAAGEERSVAVKHIKSDKERIFKNRTAFKAYLTEKNYEYVSEDYTIEDIQTAGSLKLVLTNIKKFLAKMKEATWADRVEIYLGSGETFRHRLPLPFGYKNNRADNLRPVFLNEARKYMQRKHGAKVVQLNGLETDDVVTIRSYEELALGNDPILSSNDKDAQQSSGVEVLNWQKDPWEVKLIPTVGSLYKEKAVVKGDGLMFLALQTLAGDTADTYCGYDLSEVKYGSTAAMKALQGAQTEKEVLEVVISEFKRLYPSEFTYTDCHGVEHVDADWRDMLQMYWECAYMKRSWDDPSSFVQFAGERGVYL